MAISNLKEAVVFLRDEFVNEINNHTQFKNAEVSELSDIITDVFSRLAEEMNLD